MKKILIIDDYELHADLLARRLAEHIDRSRIVVEHDGEEGSKKFFDDPEIVVVVSDYSMSPLNGEDVHNLIYQRLQERNGTFYFYTVEDHPVFRQYCAQHGVEIIPKGMKGGYRAIAEKIVSELD